MGKEEKKKGEIERWVKSCIEREREREREREKH
jgi:hypothetical protein